MKDGFVKVASVLPQVCVADAAFNADAVSAALREAAGAGAKIAVCPELCLTGYTCGDLLLQPTLLSGAWRALRSVAQATADCDLLSFVGLPVRGQTGKLYNCAAVLNRGKILALVPKTNIPNYGELSEARYFSPAPETPDLVCEDGTEIGISAKVIFACEQLPSLTVAAELCEDALVPSPPCAALAQAGALVLASLSASPELVGRAESRRMTVLSNSARAHLAYIYANAGAFESTTDLVFAGHGIIAENGKLLSERPPFGEGTLYADIDLSRLAFDRAKENTFTADPSGVRRISFSLNVEETALSRVFPPLPFVPDDPGERARRCELILSIQAQGLRTRMAHTGSKNAVVGLSGGLDSTLALLVMARAFDALSLPRSGMIAVTMPGFGTTGRTYQNACRLAQELGATLREIPIRDAVNVHFADIGHDGTHDAAYENAQARERTQILMDLANMLNGLVVGTGDLSELALGWATYNGDHMSMYGVNCSVPKTLIRYLVRYYADTCESDALRSVLLDVLDTPVSPELLPPENGVISQKTEELVGPYELHDFFLYHMIRFAFPPRKILRMAKLAFAGSYDAAAIEHWLRKFYWRFFSQQFKRSCVPDGPKVGSVGLSPRGDWHMPSDASVKLWIDELDAMANDPESEGKA